MENIAMKDRFARDTLLLRPDESFSVRQPAGESYLLSLSLSVLVQIDEICNRFEKSWKSGRKRRIEDYLQAAPPEARSRLLGELLALERALRIDRGENPSFTEYLQRFPGEQAVVRAEFEIPEDIPTVW